MTTQITRLEKQKLFFKGYFTSSRMFKSLSAMYIALECHTGKRKDDITPEVQHQFAIVGMLLQTFENRLSLDELDILIASAFLHDVVEDYPEKYSINDIEDKFGKEVRDIVCYVTKTNITTHKINAVADDGLILSEKYTTQYFDNMIENVFSVILKCFDRIHNLQTMKGVFPPEKIAAYITETETEIFPLIKKARIRYPEYYIIFITAKSQMENIIALVR